ncbi:hypothetical protein EMIT0P43_100084 [Pseudomonas jessenii]
MVRCFDFVLEMVSNLFVTCSPLLLLIGSAGLSDVILVLPSMCFVLARIVRRKINGSSEYTRWTLTLLLSVAPHAMSFRFDGEKFGRAHGPPLLDARLSGGEANASTQAGLWDVDGYLCARSWWCQAIYTNPKGGFLRA